MVDYLRCAHNEIPEKWKIPLAKLFQDRHKEFSDMPPHDFIYYLLPLQRDIDPEIGIIYSLAIKNDYLIGYGSLEYRESQYNENTGVLMVYISQMERNQGIGRRLCKMLFPIPETIRFIRSHTIANSSSSTIVREAFNVEPTFVRHQYFMLTRTSSLEKVLPEISELEIQVENSDFELISVTSSDYHDISNGYASILEYLWNKGSENQEIFPEERLHGRMKYFTDQGITVHTLLLKKDTLFVGIYETIFYQTNKYVADESLSGLRSEYNKPFLLKLMKLKALEYILKNTQVTHWESPVQDDEDAIFKINSELGFVLGKSFEQFNIPRKIITAAYQN